MGEKLQRNIPQSVTASQTFACFIDFFGGFMGHSPVFYFFWGVCETLTKVGEGHAIRGAGCYQGWSLQRDRLTGCGERGV